jgi:hypothetical protein
MLHSRKYWKVHCIEDVEWIPAGYAMYTKNIAVWGVLPFKLVVKLVNVCDKWFPWCVLIAVEAMICLANSLFKSHLWFHLEYLVQMRNIHLVYLIVCVCVCVCERERESKFRNIVVVVLYISNVCLTIRICWHEYVEFAICTEV